VNCYSHLLEQGHRSPSQPFGSGRVRQNLPYIIHRVRWLGQTRLLGQIGSGHGLKTFDLVPTLQFVLHSLLPPPRWLCNLLMFFSPVVDNVLTSSVLLPRTCGLWSELVTIDPLRFLVRCRKRRLNQNQALSISLSIDFYVCSFVLFIGATFCVLLLLHVRCVLSFGCSG